jgi:hypothetical protein
MNARKKILIVDVDETALINSNVFWKMPVLTRLLPGAATKLMNSSALTSSSC